SLVGHRTLGVVEQACGAAREGKQPPPGGGQRDPAIGALEQYEPNFILERFDPRGDVVLHGFELERILAHAARACHGLEHPKVGSVHSQFLSSPGAILQDCGDPHHSRRLVLILRPSADQARPRFSTLALRAGTPDSRWHTSASPATPSRICSGEELAKHSRSRLPAWALSVDHSGPGLIATPAASPAW